MNDFCKHCGADGGLCDGCEKLKAYQQGRADAIVIVKPKRVNAWQPYKCTCGNAVMDDSNYCKKCGAKLD